MKLRYLLCLAPLALTGCVGFNTTLFMTKSNAGLDLDMKPPTAEINISRKEGVVSPAFEGGKTPPVMASFSTRIGHDKMDSFFFGVNQTFAGGDAAVTMSKLYDRTNNYVELNAEGKETNQADLEETFDSRLQLGQRPGANTKKAVSGWLGLRKFLFGLAEPGDVRPFFFGTDTQFGLKVAWNGVGGPYPDTVKVGFNRKEVAVAPLTLDDENRVAIPSFLATVDSSADGVISPGTNALGVSNTVNWLQYFATGKSANYLARQYNVRKAMLERADPKATTESDRLKQADANIENQQNRGRILEAKVRADVDRIRKLDMTGVAAGAAPETTPKLDAALDELTKSELQDGGLLKRAGTTIDEKVNFLKKAAQNVESNNQIKQLEIFQNALTKIRK